MKVSELLHLRYKPKRPQFQEEDRCPAFRSFDLVLWHPDSLQVSRIRKLRPRTVLCLANPRSFRILNCLRGIVKGATIVVAGEDTRLSVFLKTVDPRLIADNRILYEAKDVSHPTIKSFSMGFISFYLRKSGREVVQQAMDDFASGDHDKQSKVLASWGRHWPHLDGTLEDRREADEFLEKCDFLERRSFEPKEYWHELLNSRFLLAPQGQGVQAPKLAEAWLVGTVPIVTDCTCFRDLQEAGYPLIIVKQWTDITRESLQRWEESTRAIEWTLVRDMLTERYFRENVVQGNSVCR